MPAITPLLELVEHWYAREKQCLKEMDDLLNKPRLSDKDIKRMTEVWESERRIARDTASWLMVLLERSPESRGTR